MKKRGEITVFLSLTLVLISAVICMLIETARTAACNLYFQTAVQSGMESCFGEYYRPLWEEYRLLFFYEEEPLENRLRDYLDGYRKLEGKGISFLGFSEPEICLQEAGYLTEKGGRYLQESGADYMKYHVVADAVGELISETDLVRQVRSAAEFVKTLSEYSEDILTVEEQIRKIRDLAGNLVDSSHETAEGIQNLVSFLEETAEGLSAGESWEKVREKAIFAVNRCRTWLQTEEERQGRVMQRFREEMNEYGKQAGVIQEKLQQTATQFEQGGYTGEIRLQVEEQIDNIRVYSSGGGERWEELERLKEALEQNGGISDIYRIIEGWDFSDEALFSDILFQAKELSEQMNSYKELFLPGWMEGLGDLSQPGEEYPRSRLKGLSEEALLRFFVGEDVTLSEAVLSKANVVTEAGEAEEEGFLTQTGRSVLFLAYLGECFSCFTTPVGNHDMVYEQEYLLGGKASDKGNLLYTAGELLLMREGIRFLEYLTDGAKKKEAAAAAAAVVGITGSPVLVKLLQTVILAVWALNDAATDVQALMQGKTVPLLILAGKEWADLDYSGHLKILLALAGNHRISPRCLSLIQATMRVNKPDFQVRKCLYEAEFCVEARSGSIFGNLPFVRNLWAEAEWGNRYSVRERYSYDS
ncbi:MAG: hypothetical protein HFI93_08445 [Lachnospiraceae bacterium]|nr:hypothetical protein [Lachnospiraceae bacterium]